MRQRISNSAFLFAIIIFSSIWATYLIMDKMQYEDVPRSMLEIDYESKFVFSLDGATSFIEEITCGMVCPVISVSMMIDYLWRIEKNDKRNRRKENNRDSEQIEESRRDA